MEPAIIAAVLGAIGTLAAATLNRWRKKTTSLAEPAAVQSESELNTPLDINEGTWYTAWQYDARGRWVTDEVEVKRTEGGVPLKVVRPGIEFRWIIRSRWKGSFLRGEWESLRPGATAFGNITLKVSRQGTRMCGHWIGPADESHMLSGRVVVAKDSKKVDELKPMRAFRKETAV